MSSYLAISKLFCELILLSKEESLKPLTNTHPEGGSKYKLKRWRNLEFDLIQ